MVPIRLIGAYMADARHVVGRGWWQRAHGCRWLRGRARSGHRCRDVRASAVQSQKQYRGRNRNEAGSAASQQPRSQIPPRARDRFGRRRIPCVKRICTVVVLLGRPRQRRYRSRQASSVGGGVEDFRCHAHEAMSPQTPFHACAHNPHNHHLELLRIVLSWPPAANAGRCPIA